MSLDSQNDGFFTGIVDDCPIGTRYTYSLGEAGECPDPVSRSQPDGVHGPSAVATTECDWHDGEWRGIPRAELVIYELHIGTFTPGGTFDDAIARLDHLKDIGITAVEVMPVAQCPGQRNWGYDGVFPFAVQNSYGGIAGFQRFIDACHARGLAVLLDVVYNHLGPEGNYLGQFGPYFTDHYQTPWGMAVNFDGADSEPVREYFIANALYWIDEFHVDGLRLDAIHGIRDFSPYPFLRQLSDQVGRYAARSGRLVHMIAESDQNDAAIVASPEARGHDLDGMWSDDFHHALHCLLTGEQSGYYMDYGNLNDLARAFRQGFTFTGQFSRYRRRHHGTPSHHLPPSRFVVSAQNHDQIGNRMLGERLIELTDPDRARLAAAATILSPYIPLLFMGEEMGETARFPYFIDHGDPDLVAAVRQGRREEFAGFAWQGEAPDPAAEETFASARLQWDRVDDSERTAMMSFYRELLALRACIREWGAYDQSPAHVQLFDDERVLLIHYQSDTNEAVLILSFNDEPAEIEFPLSMGQWTRRLDTSEERWQGSGAATDDVLQSFGQVRLPLTRYAAVLYEKTLAPVPMTPDNVEQHVPTATYRLQFNSSFRFSDATRLVDYLHGLGISHVYSSPIFQAVKGSTHGYDVTDPTKLNPELGTWNEFLEFCEALRAKGMGLVLDIVPNHLAIADDSNLWWQDVLEHGPSSEYADLFDISWQPLYGEARPHLILPILGDHYGTILERGELRLGYEGGQFGIRYWERWLPIDPSTYPRILRHLLRSPRQNGIAHPEMRRTVESLIDGFQLLPKSTETHPAQRRERMALSQSLRRYLATLISDNDEMRSAIDRILAEFNGQTGHPRSFDRLSRLIGEQNYRLADWHVASDEINYRRFFYINDLAAIRVEQFSVFSVVHDLVLRLVRDGLVSGLRIDHVDGLHDPQGYLQALQGALSHWLSVAAANDQHSDTVTQPAVPWIIVEKILAPNESLQQDWSANGTTGYEFLSDVNALLIDPDGRHEIEASYRQFATVTEPYDDVVYRAKRFILDDQMLSELHSLARRLHRLAKASRHTADFTLWILQEALREVIACFPVYRTYMHSEAHESDREWLRQAVTDAKRRNKAMGRSVFAFVTQTLIGELPRPLGPRLEAERRTVVARFQQLSATVMAKGMEDTTFYRYYPLASLNEVGSEPDSPALGIEAFHHHNQMRLAEQPHALLTTATHDTKRSEDIRARLNVLSEIPARWSHALTRWAELNGRHKTTVDGRMAPTANEEYLLYQTLIGMWPSDTGIRPDDGMIDRVVAYMIKAMREAKLTTRWVRPDTDHESSVEQFIRTILNAQTNPIFLDGLSAFVDSIARPAFVNSLAQVLLKAMSPGLPDFYQGTELFDDSLVDPDNRRPIDFDARKQMCESLRGARQESGSVIPDQLLADWQSGLAKMHVTMSALQLRHDHSALFQQGSYEPLHADGQYVQHVVAFSRMHGNDAALTAVPRLITKLGPSAEFPTGETFWGDGFFTMPSAHPRRWQNVLTGEEVELVLSDGSQRLYLRDLFRSFPCALLRAER